MMKLFSSAMYSLKNFLSNIFNKFPTNKLSFSRFGFASWSDWSFFSEFFTIFTNLFACDVDHSDSFADVRIKVVASFVNLEELKRLEYVRIAVNNAANTSCQDENRQLIPFQSVLLDSMTRIHLQNALRLCKLPDHDAGVDLPEIYVGDR